VSNQSLVSYLTVGHHEDKSSQAIKCTGTDNRTPNNQEKIHKTQNEPRCKQDCLFIESGSPTNVCIYTCASRFSTVTLNLTRWPWH